MYSVVRLEGTEEEAEPKFDFLFPLRFSFIVCSLPLICCLSLSRMVNSVETRVYAITAASGVQCIRHTPSPCTHMKHAVWALMSLTFGSMSAGMAAVTPRNTSLWPCGGRKQQRAATLLIIHNVASKSVKIDIRRESREINVSGFNCNLLMFSMGTIRWGGLRGGLREGR